jgi:hypothetical protein
MPHLSAATNGGQWARVGPVLGPSARPNAAAEAEAESRRGPRLLRAKSSSPHINGVFTASGTYSPCRWNTRGSQRDGLDYVDAHPRPQCRAHTTRFGQRRLRFACLNRVQPVSRQRSNLQPVATDPVLSGIVHRWHSVATQCMRLHHIVLRCCVTPVLRRGRCPGGQQWRHRCGRGMDLVPVQMWAWAWTQSRSRRGRGAGPIGAETQAGMSPVRR